MFRSKPATFAVLMQTFSGWRTLTGAILLLVICVPSFVSALHEILHTHRHHHCNIVNGDTHLHADVFGCDLCDYLTSFTCYCDQAVPFSVTPKAFGEPATVSYGLNSHQWNAPYYLRGPPETI